MSNAVAIYDKRGAVVGWLRDNGWILDHHSARWVGFLSRETKVISVRGKFLGRFGNGLFRDNSGAVVAFVAGAHGGPIKPVRQVRPIRPILPVRPIRPITPITPIKPISKSSWGLSWQRWVES